MVLHDFSFPPLALFTSQTCDVWCSCIDSDIYLLYKIAKIYHATIHCYLFDEKYCTKKWWWLWCRRKNRMESCYSSGEVILMKVIKLLQNQMNFLIKSQFERNGLPSLFLQTSFLTKCRQQNKFSEFRCII